MIYGLQNNYFLFLLGASILGLLVGSFLNVVIYRLPIMLQCEWENNCLDFLKQTSPIKHEVFNLNMPRSHCPKCHEQISWWQNIPIISYILLHGKCKHCKTTISWRYPAIELTSCLASLFIAIYFGISIQALTMLILTWSLIAAFFIDIDQQLLPDNITIPLIWLGLLLNANDLFTTPKCAVIGAISGYLIPWSIAYGFKLVRKIDGMGHGDFKLLAVFGAWLGWQAVPLILFIASLLGGIVGITMLLLKKHKITQPMPFGPYLIVAGWSMFFYSPNILLTIWK